MANGWRPALALAGLVSVLSLEGAHAADVAIGTGGATSVFEVFGQQICASLEGTDGMKCATVELVSWRESMDKLASGAVGFALLASDRLAQLAVDGDEMLATADPNAVLAFPSRSITILAAADTDIKTVGDLGGRTVRTAPPVGIWPFLQWMRYAEWGEDELRGFMPLGFENSANAVCAGEAEAMIMIDGHPGELTRLATERCPMRLIPIDDEFVGQVVAEFPDLVRTTIPAGTYPGQDAAVPTFGTYTMLAVRSDIDAETVYQLTKAVFEHADALQASHPSLANWDRDNLAPGQFPVPLHPGAERYLREAGLR